MSYSLYIRHLLLQLFQISALLMLFAAMTPSADAQGQGISFVQANSAVPQTPQTTVSVPYASAQTAGNLNIVVVGWNDSTASVQSIADTSGNTYALAVGPTVQTGYATQSIYYAKNIVGAIANGNTVTVTFTTAAVFPDIRIAEYNGLDTVNPLDVSSASQGNNSGSDSGPATITTSNDLLVGANLVQTATLSAGTGFTSRLITNPDADILEDQVVTATGSYDATAELTSAGPWIMQIVAFRAVSTNGYVQSNSATPQTPVATVMAAYLAPQSAGNLNVVVVGWNDSTAAVQSVTDTSGNTYALAVGPTVQSGVSTQSIYYAKNIVASQANANTVTVTFTTAATLPDLRIAEYSGLDPLNPLDVSTGTTGNNAAADSGPATTASTKELLVGASLVQAITTAAGTGFTNRVITAQDSDILEDQVVTATGTYHATAVLNTGQLWIMQLVAFRMRPNLTSLSPVSGTSGTSVTIAGSNFGASQGSSTVAFNGTLATPSSWSDTQIVVPVPVGASSGNVVVTVGGVPTNSLTFTVPYSGPPPTITSLYPTSAPVGALVTIAGTNLGATQGTGTVAFNGTAATIFGWSATSVTAQVPAGATTGNLLIYANGLNSNGLPFTVVPAPSITSLSPISGPVGSSITITGTNFGSSQGTSTVMFNGTAATPCSTCWNPTSIVVSVPSSATTGLVAVTVSGIVSNVASFSVTSTAPQITSLNPTSGPIGTSVTVSGANFGSSPGTITFNGTSAAISTWTATNIVATVPTGATTGPVLVSANGPVSNPASFMVYTTQPGSSTLTVNPSNLNMIVGQTQAVQLLDQNGVAITNPTWSIANSSIATIIAPVNQGDPTLLQANAIGNTTLTGTSTADNRTGTAQVSILAGTSLPIGTVQWEIPSLGTYGIANIVQSLRIDDNTPDFYVLDQGANGGNGAIRTFTADGQQKWMFTAPAGFAGNLIADDQGGVLYQAFAAANYTGYNLARLDENGNQTWSWTNPNFPASNIAIHPDGTIYFVQPDYLNLGNSPFAVVALDGTTGQTKFAIPLPTLPWTSVDSSLLNDPNGGPGDDGYPLVGTYCTPGTKSPPTYPAPYFGSRSYANANLTVSSDGKVYLPFGIGTVQYDAMPCDSSPDPHHPGFPHLVKTTDGTFTDVSYLKVMVINSDGSYSIRQLDSSSGTDTGAQGATVPDFFGDNYFGPATPDGQGGTLLAGSTEIPSVLPVFYHDTGSTVTKLNLPVNPGGEILTGEDGTAYLGGSDPTTGVAEMLAINTTSNSINWTAPLSAGLSQLLAVPAAGGIIFQDHAGHLNVTDPNGVISPLFPGSNGTDAGPVNTANANYWTQRSWIASLSDGGMAPIAGNFADLAVSQRPRQQGNAQAQSSPQIPNIMTVVPFYYAYNLTTGAPVPLTGPNSYGALISKNVQPNAVPLFRFLGQATYKQFTTDVQSIDHRLGALGYVGHSFLLGTPATSVGLCFQIDPNTANPLVYNLDCIIQSDFASQFSPAVNATILPEYVTQFASTTKVIFISACDISTSFEKLWNVNSDPSTIATRALIVPDTTEVLDVNTFDGASVWNVVAQYLSQGHTVNEATDAANAYAQSFNLVSRWEVIGNGNLRIRPKTY